MIKLFSLLFIPGFLVANGSSLVSSVPENCVYLPAAKNCHGSQDYLDQRNVYTYLDFLYWEGTERGLEFALKNKGSQFAQNVSIYQPGFTFEPAFRVGFGYHLPHDNWNLEFSYALFRESTINHVRQDFNLAAPAGPGIMAVWTSSIAFQGLGQGARWENAEAKWKIHTNFFTLLLSHRLCTSSALSFEPAVGLNMALLQQRFEVNYTNGNILTQPATLDLVDLISSKIAMKNRSFNLGPMFSILTRWNVERHIDLFGKLSGSLLASHFDIGRHETDVSFDGAALAFFFDSLRERNDFWTCRPQTAISLGIVWSDCVCRKNSVINYGFSAAYEAQSWWKQNMFFRFIDEMNGAMIVPTQGSLFFHGLTLDAFIDF